MTIYSYLVIDQMGKVHKFGISQILERVCYIYQHLLILGQVIQQVFQGPSSKTDIGNGRIILSTVKS